MHGEIRGKLIDAINRGFDEAMNITEALAIILTSPYGTSYRGFEYRLRKSEWERAKNEWQRFREEDKRLARQRVQEFLYHMRQDGLIYGANRDKERSVKLTPKGLKWLEKFLVKKSNALPIINYPHLEGNTAVIISFDIPEKMKRKRAWLRQAIYYLGFRMLHKSVWFGKKQLPQVFLDDLMRLEISHCVEIFTINKGGSLRRLKI